jgi:UDP-glucose 4-epimerase
MKKVIVTGGAGYIGSHTVVELLHNGYQAIVIDDLSNSSVENIQGAEKLAQTSISFYKINCLDREALAPVFEKHQDAIGLIHFAAYKSVEESVHHPEKYHENNVGSMESMLSLCEQYGIPNFVFSSSCTVYGQPDTLPVTEEAAFLAPTSPYAHTKQLCEELLQRNSINSTTLRYFNPIGAHSSGLIGDRSDDQASNLVPIITQVAIGIRKQLKVFGDDYPTPDGSCLRDYIHVVDLAKSHLKALQLLEEKGGKHAFNIGTGKGSSVFEIIKAFESANQLEIPYEVVGRRDGDYVKIYASTTKAEKELNWKAEIALETAMKDAWHWEQICVK